MTGVIEDEIVVRPALLAHLTDDICNILLGDLLVPQALQSADSALLRELKHHVVGKLSVQRILPCPSRGVARVVDAADDHVHFTRAIHDFQSVMASLGSECVMGDLQPIFIST
eukprot:CAMPEP_0179019726 /NCGR_PEP_ID=MMETSP0796-20121207/5018_1 /TAXON_ID=73915 /ORGANISM="Pyrodinium bahamense, Strain pbaha01" /LENGTH=112 /DNA_ID=CAMNT_0020715525 /DNA_START=44 /DNA_END=378 /DNA_ORIENTATION=-